MKNLLDRYGAILTGAGDPRSALEASRVLADLEASPSGEVSGLVKGFDELLEMAVYDEPVFTGGPQNELAEKVA
jgi:hypothetical protein